MIGETLTQASRQLTEAGIPAARREAEELLAAIVGCEPLEVYLTPEVTAEQRRQFWQWTAARIRHIPTQYLTGRVRFYGLEFVVTPATLIPRPESELLVEVACAQMTRRWSPSTALRVVDVGTGCGNLTVSLTKQRPSATLVAIDRSCAALVVARWNATRLGVADRVRILQSDGLTGMTREWAPHLIVANPPYVSSGEWATLPPEVRQEPRLALDGGADGLRVHAAWMAQASERLRVGGCLVLELGAGQEAAVRVLVAQTATLRVVDVRDDWQGIPRVLVAERWTN